MKILNLYILKAYTSRLFSVFIVLMLIFIIQTFWLFIDEFAGKGLDSETILKFLIYLGIRKHYFLQLIRNQKKKW